MTQPKSERKRGYVKHVEGKQRHKLIAKLGGAYCRQKNCEINQLTGKAQMNNPSPEQIEKARATVGGGKELHLSEDGVAILIDIIAGAECEVCLQRAGDKNDYYQDYVQKCAELDKSDSQLAELRAKCINWMNLHSKAEAELESLRARLVEAENDIANLTSVESRGTNASNA